MKCMLACLCLALPAHAFEVVPVGDGGSHEVVFQSRGVHPLQARVGTDAVGVAAEVAPFGRATILIQCLGEPPALEAAFGTTAGAIPPTSLRFPAGPPALWISREKAGRAALEARLQAHRPGLALHQIDFDHVPDRFAALRFAPVILLELSDWADLSSARREAIRGAVAAGSLLVLGGGEGPVDAAVLEELLAVRPGGVERAGSALSLALSRASGHRILTPGTGAAVRVTADGYPVVVEAPLGLGRVRVVAVRLGELDPGVVESAAYEVPPDALGTVMAWLQGASPLGATTATPLTPLTWYALLTLVALALVARRLPRLAAGAGLALAVGACFLPPTEVEVAALGARALYVPAGRGALLVGTLDLELQRGGPHVLAAHLPRISLDDARPGGACALVAPTEAAWVVEGEPGARRRLTFFALLDDVPPAGAPAGELPAWPGGPLAGAAVSEVQPPTLPLALAVHPVEARLARPAPEAAVEAVALPAPPEG